MALFPVFENDFADFDRQNALALPLGVASPLWFAFASAAGAGVAYWWMTRWTEVADLRTFGDWFAPQADNDTAPLPAIADQSAPQGAVEAPAAAALAPVEAAADAVVETVAVLTEVAPEVVEDSVEAGRAATDDLTRLVGVGPRLAARLADLGVTTFKDIAAWTDEDLATFDKALDLKGRAGRDAWVAQARRFAEG